jgi:hypothetical protein
MQAPKFCGGCGESLSILSAANTKTAASRKSIKTSRDIEIDDPDGVDIYEVPRISRLSYSIETDKNKFNLKDLIPLENLAEFKEDKPKNNTKKRGRPRKS